MAKVSIVVVNFNGLKDTVECLNSLKKIKKEGNETSIVVVDNGSENDLQSLKKIKGIELIESKENLGFAGGNNLGIKHALVGKPDYIFLLNNDTVVGENIISAFVDSADNNPTAGIFTPKIYFAPGFEFHKEKYSKKEIGRVIWSVGGVVDWNNVYATNYGVDDTDIGQYAKIRETDFATGAAMFVRPELFDSIGYLNEDYFLYLEDLEFSVRAKNSGWKIMYVPDAVVWHKVSQSSEIGGGLNDYFITRNRLSFGLKYAPLRSRAALVKESLKLLQIGREWQKKGVLDFYMGRSGKGSWK